MSQDEGPRTRAILSNDTADRGRLDTVNDVVACSGDQVTVAKDLHIFLGDSISALSSQSQKGDEAQAEAYVVCKFFYQNIIFIISIAGHDPANTCMLVHPVM